MAPDKTLICRNESRLCSGGRGEVDTLQSEAGALVISCVFVSLVQISEHRCVDFKAISGYVERSCRFGEGLKH